MSTHENTSLRVLLVYDIVHLAHLVPHRYTDVGDVNEIQVQILLFQGCSKLLRSGVAKVMHMSTQHVGRSRGLVPPPPREFFFTNYVCANSSCVNTFLVDIGMTSGHFKWVLEKAIETLAKSCCACQAILHLCTHGYSLTHPGEESMWTLSDHSNVILADAVLKSSQCLLLHYIIPLKLCSLCFHVLALQANLSQRTVLNLHTSSEFLEQNGIKHILSAPYHPSSNDLAEYFVQKFKRVVIYPHDNFSDL